MRRKLIMKNIAEVSSHIWSHPPRYPPDNADHSDMDYPAVDRIGMNERPAEEWMGRGESRASGL